MTLPELLPAPALPSTPTQVRAFFDAHRTVRRYLDEPMPAGDLDTILYAAQRAPTDATAQMYSLLRVTEPPLREQLAELTGNAHMGSAPEVFIVCLDVHRLRVFLAHHGHEPGHWPHIAVHFGVGDAVLAGQTMLIAAELLGYAGCWVGGIMNRLEELVALLALPAGVLPFAGLTLGRSAEAPAQRPRIARALVVHENTYREPTPEELTQAQHDMAPITARGDWAQTLSRYFARGGSMEQRETLLQRVLEAQELA